MNGKVVIVTGATNGIGEVTAVELARQGAEVVLISRNESKLKHSSEHIKAETGNENVSYLRADLSSIDEINAVADAFLARWDRLDVLVNNAGAYFSERRESVDGYEMTLALNHLNYFLLTRRLLDLLKQTAAASSEARIVNVSSGAHQGGSLNFDDMQTTRNYNGFRVYSQSKLMNVMFTYALARRLEDTNVTANVLHPGFVNTGFGMNNSGLLTGLLGLVQNLFAKSPQEGAQTNIYLASSPDVRGISGKYWADKKAQKSSTVSYDEAAQERLWEISEKLVNRETVATSA